MSVAPVRTEIVVEASQARAFRVFTEEQSAWWPLATHHIGATPPESAILEPRVGGRWYERAQDGAECPWGKVLVWDPPGRIVLAWQTGANWKHDPNLMTEVEVRFVSLGPAKTRIELEHRKLELMGETAQAIRDQLNSGWPTLMQLYSARAREAAV